MRGAKISAKGETIKRYLEKFPNNLKAALSRKILQENKILF